MREKIKPSEPFYWWSQILWFFPSFPNLYFLLVHCSLLPVFVIFLGVEFFFVLSVWPLACVDRRLTEMGCLEVALVGKRWSLQPSFALGRRFFTLPIFASPRTRTYWPTRGNSTIWFQFFFILSRFFNFLPLDWEFIYRGKAILYKFTGCIYKQNSPHTHEIFLSVLRYYETMPNIL